MLGLLKKLFGSKPAETTAEAPYKIETTLTPMPEPQPLPVPEVVSAPAVDETKPAPKKKAPNKKPVSKKPVTPKKEGAPKKGGRKPKAQQS